MSQPLPKSKFKIAHSLQQLQDQLILTLKDKPLLKDNKQLNQQDDLFQNEQLQQTNRMKHNSQLRKRVKQLSDVSTSHLSLKQQGLNNKDDILPHYNDYSYKNQEIEIQQNGKIVKKKPGTKPLFFKNTQNDFLSKQQLQNSNNPISGKLGKQYSSGVKIKKGFKKGSNNLTSSSETGNKQNKQSTSDLLNFLNQTAQDNLQNQEDLKRSASQAIQDAIDSIRKKRIIQFNAKKSLSKVVDISSIIGENEEQLLLNKSISKAQKKNNQFALTSSNLLASIKQQEQNDDQDANYKNQSNNKLQSKGVQIQLNPISYRGDDKKYIRKDFDVDGMKSGTTSAMFIKLPSQRLVKSQQNQKQLPEDWKDISKEQLQKMKQQVSFLEDKALGTGLSGALQFLRQNSLIGQQQQVGRTTDKSVSINNPNDRVKLQYRNQSGKLMKPKQAFRYLCATFHGQGPKKNKIQKRKKKQLDEIRMKQRFNSIGSDSNQGKGFLGLLNQHQRKNNQAHMVIDFGKKANQLYQQQQQQKNNHNR